MKADSEDSLDVYIALFGLHMPMKKSGVDIDAPVCHSLSNSNSGNKERRKLMFMKLTLSQDFCILSLL